MKEINFIQELEKKAGEQKRLLETEILPDWAKGAGEWLVVNPWRVLVPLASIMYLVSRIMYGERLREMILALFGGFR